MRLVAWLQKLQADLLVTNTGEQRQALQAYRLRCVSLIFCVVYLIFCWIFWKRGCFEE